MKKVTVVVPNYNGRHFMDECLESLQKQNYRDFRILVVDNASQDGSVEYMREKYPDIDLLALDQNYGFSRAVNEGIRHAGTPYTLLLNNDTRVDPDFVGELVKAIERSPRIFSVACKMVQMYHPELLDSAGDSYTLLGWAVNRGAGRSVKLYTEPEEIFTACAGAAIYRTRVFKQIGLFDEVHFAYLEDIDVGYRARIYGYRNEYCPTAICYHVGSGTSGSKYNSFKVKLAARNNIYLNYKNMPLLQLMINLPAILGGMILKYGFFRVKGYADDYAEGVREGLATRKNCRKVPFRIRRFNNYLRIEGMLIRDTYAYLREWTDRKILKR